jgi:uncharacterized protein YkwD
MKQLETIYRATFLASALAVVTGLTACGGGGGGGSANTFTASCSDGTTKTSSVSQADAQSQCSAASTALSTNTPTANYVSTDKLNVFNQLNADRLRCGFGSVQQNLKLDVAAQGHADYLALNNVTVGHTQTVGSPGFTGATIADRFTAAGYTYSFGSEVIGISAYGTWYSTNNTTPYPYSPTAVSAMNSFRGLYATAYHLIALMGGQREIGIGVSTRDTSGGGATAALKLVAIDQGTQSGQANQQFASDAVQTFPCEGISGLRPLFGSESPDPFPNVDHNTTAYGQPVYVTTAPGTTVTLTTGTITLRGGSAVPTTQLTNSNDPQREILSNQVLLFPTVGLASNATYDVVLVGTNSGLVTPANPTGAFTRSFSFQTGTYTSD